MGNPDCTVALLKLLCTMYFLTIVKLEVGKAAWPDISIAV